MTEYPRIASYEISASAYGVEISNDSDDSSGATRLTPAEALDLAHVLRNAAMDAARSRGVAGIERQEDA